MTEERTISLCIPTFNRYELLIESFVKVLSDDRIDEIIISDDCSKEEIYEKLKSFVSGIHKIKLFRNEQNQDCYRNKYTSLTYAKNDWAILLDSDNEISPDYIDKIFNVVNWNNYAAMLPDWAQPHFDYRRYSGFEISRNNVAQWSKDSTFLTMLNTSNHFINRNFYINCWDGTINPHTADSIYMNYLLLKNGGNLKVVEGLVYQHRVDDHRNEQSGHYNTNVHKTGNFHEEVVKKISELS